MTGLVAVTGATGFLGRAIVRAFVQQGWRVRILARQYPVHEQFSDLSLELVAGDVFDADALAALVRGANVVVHAAGLIKACKAEQFHATNVQGTENLVMALNQSSAASRLVLVSSMAARMPHLSPYAASKRLSEERVRTLLKPAHDYLIVRPCAIYGPWDVETLLLFRALDRSFTIIPQSANARICLVHAQDVAEAVVAVSLHARPGSLFEISDATTQGYDWEEIRRAAAIALGREAYAVSLPLWGLYLGGLMGTLAARLNLATPILTIDKVREIAHPDWASAPEKQPPEALWRPKITLNCGFLETVRWYRDKAWLYPRDTPVT